jgi:hypothetical protein
MEDGFRVFVFLIVLAMLIYGISTPFWAYDPPGATRVLEQQGFRDIKIKGYAWFACAKSDTYQTEFEATSFNGTRVTGVVCSGLLFKANTVRLY